MRIQLAVLVILLLPVQVFAQSGTGRLEERLVSVTGRERVELLVELTKLYHKQAPDKAEAFGTQALKILDRSPDPELELELELVNFLGHSLGALSQYREALEYATRAERLAREHSDRPALAFALSRGGYAYQKLGEATKALERHNEALSIFQQLGDQANSAFSLNGRCMTRFRIGDLAMALEDCFEAYKIYEQVGDRDELTETLNNIGLVYDDLGQPEEALAYYQKALDLQPEDGNKALIGRLLNNIGLIYDDRGDHEQGLTYLFRSLELKEEIGDRAGVSRRLSNIGDIYINLDQLDEAREYHQRGLTIAREVGFKLGIITALDGLAMIDAQQGDPETAIRRMEESIELAEEIGVPAVPTYLQMSQTYVAMGRFRQALSAHQAYEAAKSKVFSEENSRNIAEMQARFEADQKQKEIELLEQQRAVAALELGRQQNMRRALAAGFGTTLVILLLAFNRYRHKARASAMEQAVERERAVNARLREVDKLKDDFLANTSHELRTPLYGITGIAESLVDGVAGELPESAKSNLAMIVHSGRRLSHLVGDILDFSKLRHKSLELDLRPVDLRPLVEVVLTLSRPLVGPKELELENLVPADLPAAEADENRLQQILHNLVGNAVKFTASGKIEVMAAPQNGSEGGHATLRVSVRDTGIGISKDQQGRIFEAFSQADASIEREFGGTGLGLAVTRQLVDLHGGTLGVESMPGEGSTFYFDLKISERRPERPLAAAPVAARHIEATEMAAENVATEPLEGGASVLVVDDEPVIRQVLSNQLAAEGFRVVLAASGREALRLLEQRAVDLVILDVMMPRLSGFEVCRKLRERYTLEELPVIFLTAKNQADDLVIGLTAGANDYLPKPVSKSELVARVQTHLALLQVNRQLSGMVSERSSQLAERERLLGDRERLIVELESRNAELARFNHTVAHDLQNPLTTIRNFIGQLETHAENGEHDHLRSDLRRIDGAASQLHRLLNELYEFSRIDRASMPRDEVAINDLVGQALAELAPKTTERGVRVEVAAELPVVRGDRARLLEAVRYLLGNAVQYLGDQPSPRIEVGTRHDASEAFLYVRDNGMGIEPKYHDKVFELFERLDPEASEGTGIGLALVKRIVEVHGGRIWVESEGVGRGSLFCLTLPVAGS